jgi:hypothetical protein
MFWKKLTLLNAIYKAAKEKAIVMSIITNHEKIYPDNYEHECLDSEKETIYAA